MAARPKPPVFLARTSYRQRRLRDAARLLPVLGATLWMLPLLWPRASLTNADMAQSTSTAMIYIFGVWTALILASLVLARVLRPDDDSGTPQAGAPGSDAPRTGQGGSGGAAGTGGAGGAGPGAGGAAGTGDGTGAGAARQGSGTGAGRDAGRDPAPNPGRDAGRNPGRTAGAEGD